jgi:hypothetical protein
MTYSVLEVFRQHFESGSWNPDTVYQNCRALRNSHIHLRVCNCSARSCSSQTATSAARNSRQTGSRQEALFLSRVARLFYRTPLLRAPLLIGTTVDYIRQACDLVRPRVRERELLYRQRRRRRRRHLLGSGASSCGGTTYVQ